MVRAYLRRGRPPPDLCAMVRRSGAVGTVADVRTLHGHLLAGSDPAPVRLSGAAEFSAALQRGADTAGADRSPGRRKTAVRAGALGIDSALGQGPAEVQLAPQCALRVRARQASLPQCHATAALPRSRRWLLRLEGGRRAKAPLLSAPAPRETDRFRRFVGDLDGT